MPEVPIHRVLQAYLARLHAAIVRSPLLDATCGPIGRGHRIDLTYLDRYDNDLALRLLHRMMSGHYTVDVRPPDILDIDDDDQAELQKLYHQIERNLVRDADKIERETGNRSLWLGYPLLHVPDPNDRQRSILAPILLWPMCVKLDHEHQWALHVARDRRVEKPVLNQIMRAWVERRLNVRLDLPDAALRSPEALAPSLRQWMTQLQSNEIVDLDGPLQPVPPKAEVPKGRAARVFHAAILGVMRWQNQAIMDDLEELLKQRVFEGPFEGLFLGQDRSRNTPTIGVAERDRHHVTPADHSQELAVLKARAAPGVVVHGPPGTGKSQTITNIVADALARQEKVLVVCQKRAAIDVVAQRLKAAGLEDLYLTMQDATGDREPIIDLLKEQVERLRTGPTPGRADPSAQRDDLCHQIESAEQELDRAHAAYHQRRRFGLSFQQVMARLVQLDDAVEEDHELSCLLSAWDWPGIERLCGELGTMARLFAASRPFRNPWCYRRTNLNLTPHNRRRIEEILAALREADAYYAKCAASESACRIEIGDRPERFCEDAAMVLSIVETLLRRADVDQFLEWLARCAQDARAWACSMAAVSLAAEAADTVTKLDRRVQDLVPQLQEQERRRIMSLLGGVLQYQFRWDDIFRRGYRQHRRALKGLIEGWTLRWARHDLQAAEAVLRHAQGESELGAALTGAGFDSASEASGLAEWLSQARQLRDMAETKPLAVAALAATNGSANELQRWCESVRLTVVKAEALLKLLARIDQLGAFLEDAFLDYLKAEAISGNDLTEEIAALQAGFEQIDALEQYERGCQLAPAEHRAVIDHLATQCNELAATGEDLAILWGTRAKMASLLAWRAEALREAPLVAQMHGMRLHDLRAKLATNIAEKTHLEPAAIASFWRERQRQAAEWQWNPILRKRGPNAKRLRQIVEISHSHGLFDLRPCWLTNPDTASQVLPNVEGLFDLVIFDEASQLPVEQAAPSVYRGRRIVVAGDEHQLPPTSFFMTAPADDQAIDADSTGEEDADVNPSVATAAAGIDQALGCTDLLDLSKTVLPDHQLTVHYRSRHPALIQFSNWAYYKGNLEAAHPIWGVTEAAVAPIVIHRVNGVYDNKTNRDEARHVVDLLDQLWSVDHEPPTVGVVTFNQQQERLIEIELDRKAYECRDFKARLEKERNRKDGKQDVGFFVKNLESVQGDERDVIVFSTTFGPSERGDHGTFRRYFGPLTQGGGERRLNVGVTRSREGMIIVTSMPFEKISDIAGGIAPGRQIKARDFLQAYMLYADAVSCADEDGQNLGLDRAARLRAAARGGRLDRVQEIESVLEDQVYQRLISAGYTVDTQVGEAGFRIDLAVQHPTSGRGYLLGIECDGATYHSDRTARSCDVWRESILRDYGWEIFRIWSTRWWTNADAVMRELLERLNELKQRPSKPAPVAAMLAALAVPNFAEAADQAHAVAPTPTATARRTRRRRTASHQPQPLLFNTREPEAPAAEADTSAELNGLPRQWSLRLAQVLKMHEDGDIAQWVDGALSYRLGIERRRGKRRIAITQNGDTVEHCVLPQLQAEVAAELVAELAEVENPAEMRDWFRRLQSTLYPEQWG